MRLSYRHVARTAIAFVWLLAPPLEAAAQSPVHGYAYGGPAGVSGFFGSLSGLQAGGGAEWHIGGGPISVAGELGVLGNSSSLLAAASLNAAFHFMPHAPAVPFVTGGLTTMGSGEGSFRLFNVGAGVTWWASRHVGWRGEFRDQIRPDGRGAVHYWGLRAGIVVR
jgi:hypothetical protein